MELNLIFNIILAYVLFSLSVGITSYFTIYRPIIIKVRDEYGIHTSEMEYPFTAACILILLSALTAPVVLKTALTGPDEVMEEAIIEKLLERDD